MLVWRSNIIVNATATLFIYSNARVEVLQEFMRSLPVLFL